MEKISAPLFIIITLLALSQSIFAADWQPIAEITDFEKGVIAQASRQSPEWVYNNAKAFRVKHEVVVEILLKDGTVKHYAFGGVKDSTEELNRKGRAFNIGEEFYKIYNKGATSKLNAAELERMDVLLFEYFDILNSDALIANDLLEHGPITADVIGSLGNRFLYSFELLYPNPRNAVKFYAEYIISYFKKEDRPTDQEKINAIEKIKNLNMESEGLTGLLRIIFLEEIKRLDPDFYELLLKKQK